jgi:hypothetical protein
MEKLMLMASMFFALLGIASARQAPATGMGMHSMMQMKEQCPMRFDGLRVTTTDVAGGIKVAITTTESAKVEALRQRLDHMAVMHNMRKDRPAMMREGIPAGSVKYEDIPNGGQLTLTPKDESQLEAFRKQIRDRALQLEKNGCPMMQMMGEAEPNIYGHDPRHPE